MSETTPEKPNTGTTWLGKILSLCKEYARYINFAIGQKDLYEMSEEDMKWFRPLYPEELSYVYRIDEQYSFSRYSDIAPHMKYNKFYNERFRYKVLGTKASQHIYHRITNAVWICADQSIKVPEPYKNIYCHVYSKGLYENEKGIEIAFAHKASKYIKWDEDRDFLERKRVTFCSAWMYFSPTDLIISTIQWGQFKVLKPQDFKNIHSMFYKQYWMWYTELMFLTIAMIWFRLGKQNIRIINNKFAEHKRKNGDTTRFERIKNTFGCQEDTVSIYMQYDNFLDLLPTLPRKALDFAINCVDHIMMLHKPGNTQPILYDPANAHIFDWKYIGALRTYIKK